MNQHGHAQYWRQSFEREAEGYRETLEQLDIFRNWTRNTNPENTAELQLLNSLEVQYAGERVLANQFLERAIAVIDRTIAEDKLPKTAERLYPMNEGVLLRTEAYARGLLDHAQPDLEKISRAADCFEEWCSTQDTWNDQLYAYCLGGMRLAAIAGNHDQVIRIAASRKSWVHHAGERRILRDLAKAAKKSGFIDDQKLIGAFGDYFGTVRDPHYRSKAFMERWLVPFELAIIRDKYFVSPDGMIDWKRIIGSIVA